MSDVRELLYDANGDPYIRTYNKEFKMWVTITCSKNKQDGVSRLKKELEKIYIESIRRSPIY